jgi:hypothetical protein
MSGISMLYLDQVKKTDFLFLKSVFTTSLLLSPSYFFSGDVWSRKHKTAMATERIVNLAAPPSTLPPFSLLSQPPISFLSNPSLYLATHLSI